MKDVDQNVELKLTEDITLDQFWKLADDLLYTKVFYDYNTNNYFTKQFKNALCLDSVMRDFSSLQNSILSSSSNGDAKEELEGCSEGEINTLLVSYLSLVSKYANTLSSEIGCNKFYTMVANYLLEYKYYQLHSDFCIRKMLSLLSFTAKTNLHNLKLNVDELSSKIKEEINENIGINECFIVTIGFIFYRHYLNFKDEILTCLREYMGLETFLSVIENYCAITNTSTNKDLDPYGSNYKGYFIILFDICSDHQFTMEQLDCVKLDVINSLLDQLRPMSKNESETNYLKFRLLLVLNEQFIGLYGTQGASKKNVIFSTIIFSHDNSKRYFQQFFEVLMLNFNRINNHLDQILMLKYLYIVFFTHGTNKMVYFNDIKVIVDIIIRQLYDLTPLKDEYLINIYIRVLYQMLQNTQLKAHSYKQKDLHEVLQYLSGNEEASDKTKQLALKCLKGSFFLLRNTSDPQDINNISGGQPHNAQISGYEPHGLVKRLTFTNNNSCPDLNQTTSRFASGSLTPLEPTSSSLSNSPKVLLPNAIVSERSCTQLPPPVPPPRSRQSTLSLHRTSTNSSSTSSLNSVRTKRPPPPPPREPRDPKLDIAHARGG